MKAQKHIIQQQIVEVEFYDRSATQDVFAQFSRLFKTKLGDITNTLLDNTVNAHNFIKIDQLELQIGTLTYPFTDDEFADLYEQALEKALFDYATLHTINNPDAKLENTQNFMLSCIELLHFFLSNGALPWWASGDIFTKPDKTFLRLFSENPEQLKDLLLKTGVEQQVRKRLSHQFNDEIIIKIITLILPSQANFISQYFDNVLKIQKQKQIVKTQEKVFGQALWYFILTYLLVDMGTYFERRLFVKRTLTQMASHFNISYEAILKLLADAIETNPDLIPSDKNFTLFIKELREETKTDLIVNESLDFDVHLEKAVNKNHFEALHYYFFFGSLPVEYGYYPPEKISLLLDTIIKKHPKEFINVFRKQQNITQFTERLMLVAPEAALLTIIRIMEPVNSDFIINYYQNTVKIQNRKNVIKTNERELKKAILKFIFSFLFTSHGSLFSAKMFVENNIKKLAQHYNIEYKTLLLLMVQGMAEAQAIVKDQSSLFFIFTEILGEIRNSTTNKLAVETNILEQLENKEGTKKRRKEKIDIAYADNILLQDLFLFWFTQGTIPWWAKEQKTTTIAALFQELVNAEPTVALLVIKQAVQMGFKKQEILNSISKSVLQLLTILPQNENVLKIWNEFQQLETMAEMGISTNRFRSFLLKSILEAYHQLQFNSFDTRLFYAILINYLKNETGTSEDKLEKFFAIQFKENKLPHLKSYIRDSTNQKNRLLDIYKSALFLDRNTLFTTSDLERNDQFSYHEFKLLTKSNDMLKMSLTTLIDKAYDIVKYYLLHNKLPDDINIDNQLVISKIIERLIIVIFEQDQNLLHNLMRQDNTSAVAKMTLHTNFSKYSNQQGRNIANLLSEYEEKDFLVYIKQIWKQDQAFVNLNEIIYFIKHQSSDLTQQQLHKQVLQLANTTLHYATLYKGAEFTTMIKSLADNTLHDLITSHIYILNLAIKDSFEREKMLLYFREFSFYWASQKNTENANLFFYRFLAFLNYKKNWDIKHLYQQLIKVSNAIKQLNNILLENTIARMQNDTQIYLTQDKYKHEILYNLKDEVLKKFDLEEHVTIEEKKTESEIIYEDETIKLKEWEKIYIENAGLVLVHPFLSTLFDRTGLVKNGEFVSDEAKFRAPHLLQYIVNHEQESPEHALLLNKILCGIDYQEAVTSGVVLTEIEINTANELLYVVTQQWEKLKNTSIKGLQESFLQRSGSLCLSSEGWTLVVENKAYDVLLQTLPWGLSFIKNSWMTEPIFVEWSQMS
ncbi:contractile injection system tape measure protein [Flavobacterium procerum]|uniref:Contractile injection system tape measure protein n=1 Tax=Flavobacterium procerum TaxID=1455569 RepID=A0ABV6BVU4_9FLAO